MKIRIKFTKYGPLRFIGHLDVMRFFQKAIRRAGIDVTYTTGFSPHQVMSFAAPLGVGLTSNGEYMDIQVNSLPASRDGLTPCQILTQRLNNASVKGLDVVSARILPENAGNAMASVAAASYSVRFREGREPQFLNGHLSDHNLESADCSKPADSSEIKDGTEITDCREITDCANDPVYAVLTTFMAKEEILITKNTKHGAREINIRPGIYELTWSDNTFHMLVDASSAGNIKPGQVIEALLADNGEQLQENALLITREDVFTATGEQNDGNKKFISLGEIGSLDADRLDVPISTSGKENAL